MWLFLVAVCAFRPSLSGHRSRQTCCVVKLTQPEGRWEAAYEDAAPWPGGDSGDRKDATRQLNSRCPVCGPHWHIWWCSARPATGNERDHGPAPGRCDGLRRRDAEQRRRPLLPLPSPLSSPPSPPGFAEKETNWKEMQKINRSEAGLGSGKTAGSKRGVERSDETPRDRPEEDGRGDCGNECSQRRENLPGRKWDQRRAYRRTWRCC